jgi:glycosyltransferase involved in cell wall biosynthesis
MNSSRRVLIVGPLPPPAGGMANQTAQLQRLLVQEGLQVDIVNTQAPYQPEWVAKLRGVRAAFRIVPYLARLWRACGQARVVHVMANSGMAWHLFAAPAIRIAKARNCRVIVNYRGGLARDFLARSAGSVLATLRGTELIVPSGFLQQVFAEQGQEASVIPNIVDLRLFSPSAEPRQTAFRVVVPRNLEHIYGIDLALRAVALARPDCQDIQLYVAGSGPDRHALQLLAAELQITDCVTFTGSLQREDMAALMRQADVVLNPVRADNMPNSVLEALACEVPVLSTAVGGVPFIVEHGVSAWLAEPESPESLAQGLKELRNNPSLRLSLARQGKTIAQRCAWSNVKQLWLSAYFPIEASA